MCGGIAIPAESSAVIGAPRKVVSGMMPDQIGSSLSSGSSITPPVRDFAEYLVSGTSTIMVPATSLGFSHRASIRTHARNKYFSDSGHRSQLLVIFEAA